MTVTELKNIITEKNPGILKDFTIGKKRKEPGQRGCFFLAEGRYPAGWYLYENDDHAKCTMCGPFNDRSIVYACALKLHISGNMQEWKFTEQDRSIYLHKHIHE